MSWAPDVRARALVPLVAVLSLAAAGCTTHRDLVVLVPGADGHVGKVAVDDGKSTKVLDQANQAVAIGPNGTAPATLSQHQIHSIFGDALAAAPVHPRRFTLYFDEGTERLTAASQSELPAILADVRGRQAYQIEIVGHTDRLAGESYNDELSLRRAASVRDWLVASGVPADTTIVVGRGERDLVVPTSDNVAEAKNRRVEVTVR